MNNEGTLDPWISGARRVFCCHKSVLSGTKVPNSLEAVAECAAANVPRLEIDVQFLADDSMLIYHDNYMERESTGSGAISALTRESARQLRYLQDETVAIPFLEEVVDLLRDCDSVLQVDLKLSTPWTASRLDTFLQALKPLGERALVGSQAYWNVRPLQGHGPQLAIDPTWQWNVIGPLEDGVGAARKGTWGAWDDAPVAHLAGVSSGDYVRARIDDIIGLLPGASEWMVDWRTILHLSGLGEPLGALLAEHGVSLTAWTLRNPDESVTRPLLHELFACGVTTIITDNAPLLATYAAR